MAKSFDPLRFLELACSLADQSSDEACLRTAVGRAYYTVFLIARDRSGIQPTRRSVHWATIDKVKKTHRATGEKLDRLRRLRVEADYYLMPNRPANEYWEKNWARASGLVQNILPRIQSM